MVTLETKEDGPLRESILGSNAVRNKENRLRYLSAVFTFSRNVWLSLMFLSASVQ